MNEQSVRHQKVKRQHYVSLRNNTAERSYKHAFTSLRLPESVDVLPLLKLPESV